MSIVSIILLIVAALIALPFVLAAFAPASYTLTKDVIINKPKQDVFNYIKLMKNQDHYNKWVMTDPDKKKEFRGTDGTVGFVYAWDSKNGQVGKGEEEIKRIIDGHQVDHEVRFEKPFKGISTTIMTTETVNGNQTKVTWVFSGKQKYILRVLNIVLNLPRILQRDMQTSLNNLKSILEN